MSSKTNKDKTPVNDPDRKRFRNMLLLKKNDIFLRRILSRLCIFMRNRKKYYLYVEQLNQGEQVL